MLIIYNIFQVLLLILFFPLILIYVALKSKYRKHIPLRLGYGLRQRLSSVGRSGRTLWIHALSVGEVTSALPLVIKMREEDIDLQIIFSSSTQSGFAFAKNKLAPYCDSVIPFPLDIYPAVAYFLRIIRPDLFILVETDFWPNYLRLLKKRKTPVIVVNGRISQRSMAQYTKFSSFFLPMFKAISYFCVQTEKDRDRLVELGIDIKKIQKLGNLKYDRAVTAISETARNVVKEKHGFIIVAGSTHQGEEEILFQSYTEVIKRHTVSLIIAPRNIERAESIIKLARKYNLEAQLHSSREPFTKDIYLVDTLGELTSFYGCCDISFVGGSLVPQGGHNPLEPAALGKPVLFGPCMTDFAEISEELLQAGGALAAANSTELTSHLLELMNTPEYLQHCSMTARNYCNSIAGVTDRHYKFIQSFL